ncbi:glycerate kinase [Fonticella tunisiensis]|uniref:Glycerate kinase n=1 Tax=Fonticella tunisiensis TaxID=1096341 RepID=A0A4R7K440_9CLOT|nr:glycerate kinase [Fonticella tunisiensis]TDT45758.1 glycerate kinase [Fonticella tunisiensis]
MKVVVSPDSFKGSMSAKEVADAVERGIKKVDESIEVIKVPMADGGEGTVQSLVDATGGRIVKLTVKDPLMRDIESFYGILGDGKTAVIEMAAASGLPLLKKEERNPLVTTTYGTGQLIKHALDMGCRNIIMGIGGSATNDGGTGMAAALGVKFFDREGNEIGFGGGSLKDLDRIDISGLDERIRESTIVAACDVDNPLVGPGGASYIFGPQKGADEKMVEFLDKNLEHYGNILEKTMGIPVVNCPGAGAAGGLGAGLMAFLNAELKRGIDIVIETSGLEEKMKGADLVITGEGMIDYQTRFGKTPYGVAKIAAKYNIPVIAIAGGIGKQAEELYEYGFNSIFSIVDRPMTLDEAMERGSLLVENTAERIMRVLKINP